MSAHRFDPDFEQKVIRAIREYRIQNKVGQQDIATCLCMAQSNYARLEKGQSSLTVQKLSQVAAYFNVPISFFLIRAYEPAVSTATFDYPLFEGHMGITDQSGAAP